MLDHTSEAPEFQIKLNVCIFLIEDFEKRVRKLQEYKGKSQQHSQNHDCNPWSKQEEKKCQVTLTQ